jgi:hypothetical protein
MEAAHHKARQRLAKMVVMRGPNMEPFWQDLVIQWLP